MLYRREGFPEEDELVLCTVTKVLNHAIFVNLDEYDKGGLIHISEVAPGRIRNIREYVEIGKKIVCKILRINHERGHIDLSLRRVSEIEKKRKLEAIKQEQKAEKVIEIVAAKLKKNVNEIYETITTKVFQRYPFVHNFFKEVAEGKTNIKDLIPDNNLAESLNEIVMERFKPAKITIKGNFKIKCFAPDGIEVIKNILIEAEKTSKKADVEIVYLGGGKYKATIEAVNYKDAEKMLINLKESIESGIKSHDGEVEFVREGE